MSFFIIFFVSRYSASRSDVQFNFSDPCVAFLSKGQDKFTAGNQADKDASIPHHTCASRLEVGLASASNSLFFRLDKHTVFSAELFPADAHSPKLHHLGHVQLGPLELDIHHLAEVQKL